MTVASLLHLSSVLFRAFCCSLCTLTLSGHEGPGPRFLVVIIRSTMIIIFAMPATISLIVLVDMNRGAGISTMLSQLRITPALKWVGDLILSEMQSLRSSRRSSLRLSRRSSRRSSRRPRPASRESDIDSVARNSKSTTNSVNCQQKLFTGFGASGIANIGLGLQLWTTFVAWTY